MGRVVLLTVLAAALGGALAVAGTARTTDAGAPAPAAFRLADGTAGCAFDGDRLACRAAEMTSSLVLDADGGSRADDDVAVAWDETTAILRPTESWWHGGFACRLAFGEIVCERGSGSISVAADRVGGASSAVVELP